jgi:exopolysaccharide biosynthesis polyprenyl glycosylphosphotransferase
MSTNTQDEASTEMVTRTQQDHLIRKYLMAGYKLYNLAVMTSAFLLATLLTYSQISSESLDSFLKMRLEVRNFALLLLLLAIWHLIFTSFQVYQSRRLETHWLNEITDVLKATTVGVLAVGGLGLFFQMEMLTPRFLAVFWLVATPIAIASRLTMRYTLKGVRKLGRNLNHVLIVGTNPRAMEIARRIETKKGLGYHLVGFVDDSWWNSDVEEQGNCSRVTDLKGVPEYLKSHVVDEVIICVPIKSLFDTSSQITAQCEEQGITVRVITDAFKPRNGRTNVGQFEGNHVVSVDTGSLTTSGIFAKRMLDFLISLVLLVVLAPLMLLIAGLTKFTSPGPVFFTQKRIGLNKRLFNLHKFRTMVTNAEEIMAELEKHNEVSGPVFKISNDPRITPLGRFLRKTSLDELPQLINVFKGDMSLVGPRPLPLRDYEGFEQDWHRRRLSVPPGITCLWQVQGRNSIPFERWMELDMEYIDHWSLWLDLKIMLKTIPAVLRGSGAS